VVLLADADGGTSEYLARTFWDERHYSRSYRSIGPADPRAAIPPMQRPQLQLLVI
jgi:hypothetical protein